MQLSNRDIKRFQALYVKYFGVELSYEDAYKKLSKLVKQMGVIYRPITKEQVKRLTRHDNK